MLDTTAAAAYSEMRAAAVTGFVHQLCRLSFACIMCLLALS